MRRLLAKLGLAATIAATLVTGAAAQNEACRALLADYGRLQARSSGRDPAGEALAQQQQQLQRALSDHERMCSTGIFSQPSPMCPQIARKISEMQTNLQRLQSRAQAPQPVDPQLEGDKARLLAAISARGCTMDGSPSRSATVPPAPIGTKYITLQGPNGPQTYREDQAGRMVRVEAVPGRTAPTAPQPERRGFLEALFGAPARSSPPPGVDLGPSEGGVDALLDDGSGAYRTLCVRMCDGYYFPISYATSPSRFSTDTDICRARCPASQTRLFVHPTSAESETAVAADDMMTPYTGSPNALKYRTQVVSGCGCGRPDLSLMPPDEGGRPRSASRTGEGQPDMPVPEAKPRLDDDPDTRWNEMASFIPTIGMPAAADATDPAAATKRTVRIVGPKSYIAR